MIDDMVPSFGPATGRHGDSFLARAASPSAVRRHIDRRGLSRFGAGATACALLATALFVQIWLRTQVTQEAYELARLTKEGRRLESERRTLKGELARLASPPRIEQLAREQLGMGPAKAEQVLILRDGATVVRPVSPSAAAQKRSHAPAIARR